MISLWCNSSLARSNANLEVKVMANRLCACTLLGEARQDNEIFHKKCIRHVQSMNCRNGQRRRRFEHKFYYSLNYYNQSNVSITISASLFSSNFALFTTSGSSSSYLASVIISFAGEHLFEPRFTTYGF